MNHPNLFDYAASLADHVAPRKGLPARKDRPARVTPHPYKIGDRVVRVSGTSPTASKGQTGKVVAAERIKGTGITFIRVWIDGTPRPKTKVDAPVWYCIYVRPAQPMFGDRVCALCKQDLYWAEGDIGPKSVMLNTYTCFQGGDINGFHVPTPKAHVSPDVEDAR